jgi:hypothetical protein
MRQHILAIDPGTTQTAWVYLVDGIPLSHGKWPNEDVLAKLRSSPLGDELLAVEMIASYGMPVGAEVFDTCVWIGRFLQAYDGPHVRVFRREVKLHLCASPRANDASIRQAILDRFGGKEAAVGKKAKPGPLYGIKADVWAALAVGLTIWDRYGVEKATEVSSHA